MKPGLAALAAMALLAAACTPAQGLSPEPQEATAGRLTTAPRPAAEVPTDGLCLACHGQEGLTHILDNGQAQTLDRVDPAAFETSAHGKETCVSCHKAQATLPHEKLVAPSEGRPGDLIDAIALCSSCHQEAYEGYFHTAHGTVKNLGDSRAPGCVDCHGAHNVQRIEEWTYEARGEMCAECHHGADATFARSAMGHREASRNWFPTSYFAGRFLIVLTAAVLAIGVLHTELDILRWGIARATGFRREGRGQ